MALLDAPEAGHDLTRRAESALECVLRDERLLQRVEFAVLTRGQALDGGDLGALQAYRQRQTRVDATPADQDGARPTGPGVAALLGPGQTEPLAQQVQQRRPVVDRDGVPLAVDGQRDTAARRPAGRLRYGAERGRGPGQTTGDGGTAHRGGRHDERAPGRRRGAVRRRNGRPGGVMGHVCAFGSVVGGATRPRSRNAGNCGRRAGHRECAARPGPQGRSHRPRQTRTPERTSHGVPGHCGAGG